MFSCAWVFLQGVVYAIDYRKVINYIYIHISHLVSVVSTVPMQHESDWLRSAPLRKFVHLQKEKICNI